MNLKNIRMCIPVKQATKTLNKEVLNKELLNNEALNNEVLYHIYLENSFEALTTYLEPLTISNRKLCIVSDNTVWGHYGESLQTQLTPCCKDITSFTFPAGEENKTLDTVKQLYEHLICNRFERGDMLIALGGGVVGDLTGYTAATYLRGIDFIQIPTTLLSQVDSSIGGKTGVDFDGYKNMVGAFYQPKLVYINVSVLKTLSDIQYYSGMGEILKHGLIKDANYYEWTISQMETIANRDATILMQMISTSCEIKRAVVEDDPYEKGARALLNFGHTLGHAIEKLSNFKLLHGHCVALGYIAAAHISYKRDLLTLEELYEIRDMNMGFELPISISDMDEQEILKITKSDKKMDGDKIKFILLKKIGHAFVDKTVTDDELLEAIHFLKGELTAGIIKGY